MKGSSNDTPLDASDLLSHALRNLVRDVIREELDVLRAELMSPPPAYRDRHHEAARLGISVATLDRLCREGMPCVYVGESRRFRAHEVDEWLSGRRGEVQS